MKIYIASDHAGFELKQKLIEYVKELAKSEISDRTSTEGFSGYEVKDHGAFEYNKEDDYPDFVVGVAKSVAEDPENSRGIVLGMSGQGEAMVANRFPGVRATVWYGGNEEIIKLSREHNDANILSIGARFVSEEEAKKAVDLWLATSFSGDERHARRNKEIDSIE